MATERRRFRFGDNIFDLASGELTTPSGRERLQPKPAQVLGLLLQRAGQLVTREELQQNIWPETSVDFDQGLNYCIRQIRSALGEEADGDSTIETLPRRGYRLRVAVEPIKEAANSRRLILGAVLLVMAGIALTAWWLEQQPGAGPMALERPVRVAVLPLSDASGDEESIEENRRLTEALIVELTAWEEAGIGVLGPATTNVYQGLDRPHTEIGIELGVAFVVSGGYRASDGMLFVQMIRVADGKHVFARRRELTLARRDEMIDAVVDGIIAALRSQ